jgi:hypothetical protein
MIHFPANDPAVIQVKRQIGPHTGFGSAYQIIEFAFRGIRGKSLDGGLIQVAKILFARAKGKRQNKQTQKPNIISHNKY